MRSRGSSTSIQRWCRMAQKQRTCRAVRHRSGGYSALHAGTELDGEYLAIPAQQLALRESLVRLRRHRSRVQGGMELAHRPTRHYQINRHGRVNNGQCLWRLVSKVLLVLFLKKKQKDLYSRRSLTRVEICQHKWRCRKAKVFLVLFLQKKNISYFPKYFANQAKDRVSISATSFGSRTACPSPG